MNVNPRGLISASILVITLLEVLSAVVHLASHYTIQHIAVILMNVFWVPIDVMPTPLAVILLVCINALASKDLSVMDLIAQVW